MIAQAVLMVMKSGLLGLVDIGSSFLQCRDMRRGPLSYPENVGPKIGGLGPSSFDLDKSVVYKDCARRSNLYTTLMFVRWQSRKRNKPAFGHWYDADGNRLRDTHWQAILVKSRRVDGKPRQQHIACIASFTESAVESDMQRCYIWETVDMKLHGLNNRITQADREQIEAVIAAKVPRPTPEEHKAALRRKASLLGWEWLRPEEQALLADEEATLRGAETSVDRINLG